MQEGCNLIRKSLDFNFSILDRSDLSWAVSSHSITQRHLKEWDKE
jgi:hypothetical protein